MSIEHSCDHPVERQNCKQKAALSFNILDNNNIEQYLIQFQKTTLW